MRRYANSKTIIPFYGLFSWGNFFDWLVTICLGGLFVIASCSLGSIRPETHSLLLPIFALLLFLHGCWYAVEDKERARLSLVPFIFVPFLVWVAFSASWLSPAAWRGWQDWVYYLEAFIFLWVLCNNGRSISHLWVICLFALVPIMYAMLIGFYQLFQNPNLVTNAWVQPPVEMSAEYVGQSTGIFADPHSFALLLLIAIPCILFTGLAARLTALLRILCVYVAVVSFACLVLTQVFWVYAGFALMLLLLPWFLFKRANKRIFCGLFMAIVFSLIGFGLCFFNSTINERVRVAWTVEGEGIRRILWPEALTTAGNNLVAGVGSGAWGMMVEQSPRVRLIHSVQTPLNDALHIFAELGLVGLLLIVLPVGYLLIRAIRSLQTQPFVKFSGKTRKRLVMPSRRFFLSLSMIGSAAFLLGSLLQGVLLLPVILFTGVIFLGLLIKSSFTWQLCLPRNWFIRVSYTVCTITVGILFVDFAIPILRAREIELVCSQRLEEIVESKRHLTSNQMLLNDVIESYAHGCLLYPENADLWIGRSQATAQRFFGNPSIFEEIGEESLAYARRAVDISPEYAAAWSQLGLAYALSGNVEAAEVALLKGIELAPNSSNAHYYWASFASAFPDKVDSAKQSAKIAVEIKSDNKPALRIDRKLNIL